jgi:hypothetical protein
MSSIDVETERFLTETRSAQPGTVSEFAYFLLHNKKWWLTPVIVILLMVGGLLLLGGTVAAPFIYPLF